MGYSVNRIRKLATTTTVANAQAFLRALAQQITDASSNWTVTQDAAVYDTNYVVLILGHTSGAEIALAAANSLTHVSAANSYLDTQITNYPLQVAFKPSTAGASFATISDTVNPKDTATYTSDANAYRFMAFTNDTVSYRWFDIEGSFAVSVDDTYANVNIVAIRNGNEPFQVLVIRDDQTGTSAFVDVVSGDTKQSFFGTVRLDLNIMSQSYGTDHWLAKAAFFDNGGTLQENGRYSADINLLSIDYEDLDEGDYNRERVKLIKAVGGGWTQGYKGLFHVDTTHVIRDDAFQANQTGPAKEWIHLNSGICVPWQPERPLK